MSFESCGVTPEVLDYYLSLSESLRKSSVNDIYLQLLWSAQNANMRATVVGKSMDGGVNALAGVLSDFDPSAVRHRYGDDWAAVLDAIVAKVGPRGQIRRGPRSIWPRYCRSILTGASFLEEFGDAEAFYAWADAFDVDDTRRLTLPTVVSSQVEGLGFALSCDFLKEIGYSSFGKPDVHIRKILAGLGVMGDGASDPDALMALWRFSRSAGQAPYYVDKLMWLVGSGNFYHHHEIGDLPTNRDGFVASQRYLFAGSV